MKEIIVIRTSDPDGSVFHSIIRALQGKDVQILHAADLEPSSLTLGDIEIFPEQRRVLKDGGEISRRYRGVSKPVCMDRLVRWVFRQEILVNAAYGVVH